MGIRTKTLRNYFDWRARMITFATILIGFACIAGLVVLITYEPEFLPFLGILLQFVGVFALIPDVVGRDTVFGALRAPQINLAGRDPLRLYERRNKAILWGNGLTSLLAAGAMGFFILFPQQAPARSLFLFGVGVLGFFWLNLLMLLYIFRFQGLPAPEGAYIWFLRIDFLVTIPGIILSAFFHVWLGLLPKLVQFTFRNGIYRVLLIITLPCLLVGLMLELIGSYPLF